VTGVKNNRSILHEFVVSDDDIKDLATIKDFSFSGYAHTVLGPSTVILSGGQRSPQVALYTFELN
jgi:hypothetical protein